MGELGKLIEERIRHCANNYWPPEGAECIGVEIGLLFNTETLEQIVRKVERYPDRRYKKFGLSWKTGEWLLVQEGRGYPSDAIALIADKGQEKEAS